MKLCFRYWTCRAKWCGAYCKLSIVDPTGALKADLLLKRQIKTWVTSSIMIPGDSPIRRRLFTNNIIIENKQNIRRSCSLPSPNTSALSLALNWNTFQDRRCTAISLFYITSAIYMYTMMFQTLEQSKRTLVWPLALDLIPGKTLLLSRWPRSIETTCGN